ncbi:hypothetical protein JCM24511_05458 [Saitozyma sp. JCM 24511]|nr:hypothetical protein JCM24511_05458 [Saitozyma sp. JCM 24511]
MSRQHMLTITRRQPGARRSNEPPVCQAMKPSDEPINEPSNLVMRVAVCAKDEDEDEDEEP